MRRRLPLLPALLLALSLLPEMSFAASSLPLQLEMHVPFEPTAFPSDGRLFLCYELYLTNFSSSPIDLKRLEVLDAERGDAKPIAAFEAGQLDALLQPIGVPASSGDRRQIAPGATAVLFMWISHDRALPVPARLRHHVFTTDSEAQGALIGTLHTELRVLGAPLQGANWLVSDGPGNEEDNHHRRGIFVVDGHAEISRRYAIDWMESVDGTLYSGDPLDNRSYYAYGKSVLAVADATVVTTRDGIPDNVPRHSGQFHAAVSISMETVAGNNITLDLGGGQFAHYMHLQPGSLRVKVGDRVRRGQVLARIGDSGDARGPHLHFQVSTSVSALAGEGVPYVIDKYCVAKQAGGITEERRRELPLNDMHVQFCEAKSK